MREGRPEHPVVWTGLHFVADFGGTGDKFGDMVQTCTCYDRW